MSGQKKFSELLEAVRAGDQNTLENLRKDWKEIGQYVETHDEEVAKINLDEKQPALILWLSTPPMPEPINWNDLTKDLSFVLEKREQQVNMVNRLWQSWSSQRIIRELQMTLSDKRFKYADDWCSKAKAWFASFTEQIDQQEARDVQFRIDVVAAYSAFMDQLLLDQGGDPAEAWVSVLGYKDPILFELPDGRYISPADAGKAIEFRADVESSHAEQFAYAISYSLPAHQYVLPTMIVEIDLSRCLLRSTWEDPLDAARADEKIKFSQK